jgi:hypothetical protein
MRGHVPLHDLFAEPEVIAHKPRWTIVGVLMDYLADLRFALSDSPIKRRRGQLELKASKIHN